MARCRFGSGDGALVLGLGVAVPAAELDEGRVLPVVDKC